MSKVRAKEEIENELEKLEPILDLVIRTLLGIRKGPHEIVEAARKERGQ